MAALPSDRETEFGLWNALFFCARRVREGGWGKELRIQWSEVRMKEDSAGGGGATLFISSLVFGWRVNLAFGENLPPYHCVGGGGSVDSPLTPKALSEGFSR